MKKCMNKKNKKKSSGIELFGIIVLRFGLLGWKTGILHAVYFLFIFYYYIFYSILVKTITEKPFDNKSKPKSKTEKRLKVRKPKFYTLSPLDQSYPGKEKRSLLFETQACSAFLKGLHMHLIAGTTDCMIPIVWFLKFGFDE